MTDSPIHKVPLDPKEQPILDKLLGLRDHLELMKQDKSCFLKTDQVEHFYSELIEQIHSLNQIRVTKRNEQNRVDTVLDDCLQLISLAFLAVGKNAEAPAIYSTVSVIKRLLDHVKQAAFYCGKDLEDISRNLSLYRETINQSRDSNDPEVVLLLEARLDMCDGLVKELQSVLDQLPPELMPYNDKLVSILRSLAACNVKTKYPETELTDLIKQLRQIEAELKLSGVYPGHQKDFVDQFVQMMIEQPEIKDTDPHERIVGLLNRNLIFAEVIQERGLKISDGLKPLFKKLLDIRNALENKYLVQKYCCRETDLYIYLRQLNRIDESRDETGNFLDEKGAISDLQTNRTLMYLIRKSYVIIYMMLTRSEPVSEALLPVYNQLKTLRKCLQEVQDAGGINSSRELYPYSMKLASISNMQKDGKFMIGSEIPGGQAAVAELLEECYSITSELASQASEDSDQE